MSDASQGDATPAFEPISIEDPPKRPSTTPPLAVPEVYCTADPEALAAAYCIRCRLPWSGPYLVAVRDGTTLCQRCVRQRVHEKRNGSAQSHAHTDNDSTAMRNPAQPNEGLEAGADPVLAKGWGPALVASLFLTRTTFTRPWSDSIAPSVRFGYLCTLIGLMGWFLWLYMLSPDLLLEQLAQSSPDVDPEQTLRVGLPFVIPVYAAVRMLAGAAALHAGARLAGAPSGTLRENFRAFALTSGAMLLCVIPSIGALLMIVVWLSAAMNYLRARYDFGTLRALMAMLPSILFLAIFGPQ